MIEHYLTADKKAQLPAGSLDTIQLTQDAAVFGKQKIGEWKDLFIEHAFPLVAEIEQAFAAGDEDLVARLAHKLKSGCASLGCKIRFRPVRRWNKGCGRMFSYARW
ncbi:Sensor protein torS [Serratia fonticola]|uniref:Sensor protein torS n=1 Tax=Serratia fonticola TaxID=47917 RepID=A0A4U9VUU4_SERFO|nr:Sensor protein torS [Serratia fonticola]